MGSHTDVGVVRRTPKVIPVKVRGFSEGHTQSSPRKVKVLTHRPTVDEHGCAGVCVVLGALPPGGESRRRDPGVSGGLGGVTRGGPRPGQTGRRLFDFYESQIF